MSNRLLSEQEIIGILGWPTMPDYELHQATAAAQLAKTDKEWVKWMEDNLKVDQVTPNITYLYLRITDKQWQERKKEIGL